MVIRLRDFGKLDCSFKKECDSCKVELSLAAVVLDAMTMKLKSFHVRLG